MAGKSAGPIAPADSSPVAKAGFPGAPVKEQVSPTGTGQRVSAQRHPASGQFTPANFIRRHPSTRHY